MGWCTILYGLAAERADAESGSCCVGLNCFYIGLESKGGRIGLLFVYLFIKREYENENSVLYRFSEKIT